MPPVVIATTPVGGDPSADAGAPVTITFSEAVDVSTVTTASIAVTQDGSPVAGSLTVSGGSCTFTPDGGFRFALTYDVSISTAVEDLAGNALAAPYSFRFTTRPAAAYRPAALLYVSPPERANDTDPDAVISATFAEELDVATVTGAAFRVTRGGEPVAGLLSYAERRITLTPEQELETGAEYVVTLGSELRTASGAAPVPGGYTWTFTVRTLAGSISVVDAATTFVNEPQIDADAQGNVVVAWLQSDGTPAGVGGPHLDVWAARRSAAGVWGSPELVGAIHPGTAAYLRLRCASAGACVAVWRQYDAGGTWVSRIWANRYVPGTGWGTPAPIDAEETYDEPGLDLASTPDGVAVSVWIEAGRLLASRFVPGAGWEAPQTVDTSDIGASWGFPRISMNASGSAVVVWARSSGTWDVFAARYIPGGGWTAAESIEAAAESAYYYPSAAIDPDGNAIAVWAQDGTRWNRFTPGEGWGAARAVSAASGAVYAIGADDSRRAVVAYAGGDGAAAPWAATFDPVGGWGAATQLASHVEDPWNVPLVLGPAGDGAVAWKGPFQLGGGYRYIWLRRYDPGTRWQAPVAVAALGALASYDVSMQLARAGTGEILTAWSDREHVRVSSLP
jgi:hypothetical protein